jgi:hypothetical protein
VSELTLVIDDDPVERTILERAPYRRPRGLRDASRAKTVWQTFGRVGFREGVAPAHG